MTPYQTKLWYLQNIKLFVDMPRDEISAIERMTTMQMVKRRQPIYLPGDPGDKVFLLKTGQVKLSRISDEGKELTIAILNPGDIFGELEVLDDSPRDAMAEALEDTSFCVMRREDFESLLKRRPDLTVKLTKLIGLRLKRIENRVEDLVFKDVPSRLAGLLLQLSQEFGVKEERGLRLRTKVTHQEMANLIGSTRETVTATLGDFKRAGLVELDGHQIIIKNTQGLAGLSR